MPKHPATFSDELMPVFQRILDELSAELGEWPLVLDPFAGTGRIHELVRADTIGVEIEPEWAHMNFGTIVGDATNLPSHWTDCFDVVLTSPAYGNRMADHHEARDDSKRITYRHYLGRPLSENSGAKLQWGEAYCDLHVRAWREVHRVLVPAGLFVLNIKDHIRNHEVVPVSAWHDEIIQSLGFRRVAHETVEVTGMGFGANRDARLGFEHVYQYRKEPS